MKDISFISEHQAGYKLQEIKKYYVSFVEKVARIVLNWVLTK